MVFVQPRTVMAWQRKRFRDHWARLSRGRKPGRPAIAKEIRDLVSLDFFVVPTVTHKVLFVFLMLARHRRRAVRVSVTEHLSAQWTAQQVVEAFPWNEAPRYLRRDRDRIYGAFFRQRVQHVGIEDVMIAPRSPWQNPYVERLIGSIRRECLDHVVVLSQHHLRCILTGYLTYDHAWRTHLALGMDRPGRRPVQPPKSGQVIAVPEVGGLHHHYERRAA